MANTDANTPTHSHNDYYSKSTVSTVQNVISNIYKLKAKKKSCKGNLQTGTGTQKPFTMVSYAQTLDGNIAILDNDNPSSSSPSSPSSNLKLSSRESFLLTHALRSKFDGILIGGKTLNIDNPRLNNRLWSDNWVTLQQDDEIHMGLKDVNMKLKQPTPIILDTSLSNLMTMMDPNSHTLVKAALTHECIIICCSQHAYNQYRQTVKEYCTLHNVRIDLCPCECAENENGNANAKSQSHGLNLEDVLYKLKAVYNMDSVMVEGGAAILSAFLSNRGRNGHHHRNLVDCVCVTICPRVVGRVGMRALGNADFSSTNEKEEQDGNAPVNNNGNGSDCNSSNMLEFETGEKNWFSLGPDCIFLAACQSGNSWM